MIFDPFNLNCLDLLERIWKIPRCANHLLHDDCSRWYYTESPHGSSLDNWWWSVSQDCALPISFQMCKSVRTAKTWHLGNHHVEITGDMSFWAPGEGYGWAVDAVDAGCGTGGGNFPSGLVTPHLPLPRTVVLMLHPYQLLWGEKLS